MIWDAKVEKKESKETTEVGRLEDWMYRGTTWITKSSLVMTNKTTEDWKIRGLEKKKKSFC